MEAKQAVNLEIIYGRIISHTEDIISAEIKTSRRNFKETLCEFHIFRYGKGNVLLVTTINEKIFQAIVSTKNGTLEEIKSNFPPINLEEIESVEKAITQFVASKIQTRIEFVNILDNKDFSEDVRSELLQVFQKIQSNLPDE